MKKSIIIGIAVMLVATAGILSILKTTLGDEVTEFPGEEGMEKTLHLQEVNEQKEYVKNEANQIGEYGK